LGSKVLIRSGSAKASTNKLLLRAAFFIGLLVINGIIVAAASSCDDVEECISWTLSLNPDSGGEEQEPDFDPPGEPDDRSDTLPTVCCASAPVRFYPFLNVTSLLFSVHPLLALRPPNAS
jgi:hypothetical protein